MRVAIPAAIPAALALLVVASACSDETTEGQSGADTGAQAAETGGQVGDDAELQEVVDAGPMCPGEAGCPCDENVECDDGACIDTPDGRLCAARCVDTCPSGFACRALVGGEDATLYCVPKWGLLCRPCDAAGDCAAPGVKDTECVDYDSEGGFCGAPCTAAKDCPTGYGCGFVEVLGGGKRKQCVRSGTGADVGKIGICGCSPAAKALQLATTCWVPWKAADGNIKGRCKGERRCEEAGLSACEALTGTAKLCVDTQCLADATGKGGKDGDTCDDEDPCTTGDHCDSGKCVGNNQCACQVNDDCAKRHEADKALLGKCAPTYYCDNTAVPYACQANVGSVPKCDSAADTACAKYLCLPETGSCGLLPKAADTPCDDEVACTEGDVCDGDGKCKSGTDICACHGDDDCAKLDDGNPCTGTLYCSKSKVPYACKVNPATIPKCDKTGDTTCLRNICTKAAAKCVPTPMPTSVSCTDNNACTDDDVCDGKGGCAGGTWACKCKTNADCAGHDDGNVCNGVMYCHKALGKCVHNPATVVNCPSVDDTPCMANVCAPKKGTCAMVARNEGGVCSDGNPCTKSEVCIISKDGVSKDGVGKCGGGTFTCQCSKDADCDKHATDKCKGDWYCDKTLAAGGQVAKCRINPATAPTCLAADDAQCRVRVCLPATGKCALVAKPEGGACDADGNPCTPMDSCVGAKCEAGANLCHCEKNADCAKSDDGDACNGTLFCDKSAGVKGQFRCRPNPATVVKCPSASDT